MSTFTTTRMGRTMLPLGLAAALALAGCSGNSAKDTASGSAGSSTDGFKVNVGDCADPAAAQKKITGTFTIGYSAPLSGPVAGPVELATAGYKARIAAQNAAGGINGVKIKIVYKDDAFQPDKAKANGTEFLQSLKVDAVSTFGGGALGAMADDQNAACVPMLYPSAAADQFANIASYPWTVQFLPPADSEARFVVARIKAAVPSGGKIGIAENQAAGKTASVAVQKAAKAAGLTVSLVTPDTDPNAAATALKAAGIDIVYHAGIVGSCGVLDGAMGRIGYKPKFVIKTSNCVSAPEYIAAGAAANGVEIPSYLKDPTSPASANDTGVKTYLKETAGAKDPGNAVTVAGWTQADLLINTLKQAAASKDGLTRVSIIEAARNQKYASPMLINGVEWMSQPTKLTGVDGFQSRAWNASKQRFLPEGAVITLDK